MLFAHAPGGIEQPALGLDLDIGAAEFAVIPPSQTMGVLWDKAEDFAAATLQSPEGLLMTPRRTGTDGFFVSVLKKQAVS